MRRKEHKALSSLKNYVNATELIDGYHLYADRGEGFTSEVLIGRPLSNGNVSLCWYSNINRQKKVKAAHGVLIPETGDEAADIKQSNQKTIDDVKKMKAEADRPVTANDVKFTDFVLNVSKGKSDGAKMAAKSLAKHLEAFIQLSEMGDVYLSDIDTDFVEDFNDFLKHDAKVLTYKDAATAPHIKPNTQNNMLVQLSVTLNEAVRKGLIDINPVTRLSAHDRPQKELYNRTFLTKEELKQLAATPFPVESKEYGNNVANAFMFSCTTGLRFSDVSKIKGLNIGHDDNGQYIQFDVTKTTRRQKLYIPKAALQYMPKKVKAGDLLFPLPSNTICNKELRKWADKAGIDKAVTFHVSRHTAATMYLNAGATLETVAFQLGHKSTRVTEIYAEIMNKTQKAATNLLDNFLE